MRHHAVVAQLVVLALVSFGDCHAVLSQDNLPTDAEVKAALRKAGTFFHQEVATHGGYVWSYSGDLSLREGEAITNSNQIIVNEDVKHRLPPEFEFRILQCFTVVSPGW